MRGKSFFKRTKEKEEELNKELQNSEKLGAKDTFAMLLSAFLVIVPITVLILVAISLLLLWLFGAL